MSRGLLLAVFDFSNAAGDEFHDWYDLEHIPERRSLAGFDNVRHPPVGGDRPSPRNRSCDDAHIKRRHPVAARHYWEYQSQLPVASATPNRSHLRSPLPWSRRRPPGPEPGRRTSAPMQVDAADCPRGSSRYVRHCDAYDGAPPCSVVFTS